MLDLRFCEPTYEVSDSRADLAFPSTSPVAAIQPAPHRHFSCKPPHDLPSQSLFNTWYPRAELTVPPLAPLRKTVSTGLSHECHRHFLFPAFPRVARASLRGSARARRSCRRPCRHTLDEIPRNCWPIGPTSSCSAASKHSGAIRDGQSQRQDQ